MNTATKLLAADACEILGCSPSWLGKLVEIGRLRVLERVGRKRPIAVFSIFDVEALAASGHAAAEFSAWELACATPKQRARLARLAK